MEQLGQKVYLLYTKMSRLLRGNNSGGPTYLHLLVEHLARFLKCSVLVLVTNDPRRRLLHDVTVDEDVRLGLYERLEHERGQPHAAGRVAVPKRTERTVTMLVRQLALITLKLTVVLVCHSKNSMYY